jgi:hypothetical protein
MDSKRAIEKVFRKFDIHRQPSDFVYWQTQPMRNGWRPWKKSAGNIKE